MVLVHPHSIPFLFFESLTWDQMCRLLSLHFCCNPGVMADLFDFNDVLNVAKALILQKKRGKKRLVKIASLSQGVDSSQLASASSQTILDEAALPLSIVLMASAS